LEAANANADSKAMRKKRWWLLLLVLGALLAGFAMAWQFTGLSTYCLITVDSLDIDSDGMATMSLTKRYFCPIALFDVELLDGRVISEHAAGRVDGFFLVPVDGWSQMKINLHEDDEGPGITEPRAYVARLQVESGQTYKLTPDRPLTFSRYIGASGRLHEFRIEVKPGNNF
jgi:hypothetical protein